MRWYLLLGLALLAFGCGAQEGGQGGAGGPPEKAAEKRESRQDAQAPPPGVEIPAYDVTAEARPCEAGLPEPETCISVSTDATSSEDLELVTRDLGRQHPEAKALAVTFFPNEPQATSSGSGFVFSDRAAAEAAISSMFPQGAEIRPEVDEVMENDGVYVIAMNEMVDEMVAEQCRTWGYEATGEPPAEWDCERFR